jgi:hypothetical protein
VKLAGLTPSQSEPLNHLPHDSRRLVIHRYICRSKSDSCFGGIFRSSKYTHNCDKVGPVEREGAFYSTVSGKVEKGKGCSIMQALPSLNISPRDNSYSLASTHTRVQPR